jgi:hypothetical protein
MLFVFGGPQERGFAVSKWGAGSPVASTMARFPCSIAPARQHSSHTLARATAFCET